MEYVKSCAVLSSVVIGEIQQQQSPDSFVPTSFGRRRHCWVCTDIWMDIFPLFDRPQLGLKLALISPRFDALVAAYFNGKRELALWRDITIRKDDVAAVPELAVDFDRANSVQFPLPDRSLPNKIRFHLLYIKYIDHSLIAFLRANQQIWDKGTDFSLWISSSHDTDAQSIWDVFVCQIWPIFAPNIRRLQFYDGDHLDNLRRLISPTILTDLNIISIFSCVLFPDPICDDGPNATAGQALSKWLHTPRKDGHSKRLNFLFTDDDIPKAKEFVNSFKEAFLRATDTSSASYKIQLIIFGHSTSMVPFELVNDRTQQKLTLMRKASKNAWDNRWEVKRCQIGGTTAAVQWEDENVHHLNTVYFSLCKQCIGALSPPPAEQEKAGQSVEKGGQSSEKEGQSSKEEGQSIEKGASPDNDK